MGPLGDNMFGKGLMVTGRNRTKEYNICKI
jgi:hypothetical protein